MLLMLTLKMHCFIILNTSNTEKLRIVVIIDNLSHCYTVNCTFNSNISDQKIWPMSLRSIRYIRKVEHIPKLQNIKDYELIFLKYSIYLFEILFWYFEETTNVFFQCVNYVGKHVRFITCMLSHIQLYVALWTRAGQAPLSMRFSKARITGVNCHALLRGSSRIKNRTCGISCVFCISGGFLTAEPPRKPERHNKTD